MKIGDIIKSRHCGLLFKIEAVSPYHIFAKSLPKQSYDRDVNCRKDKFNDYYEIMRPEGFEPPISPL